MSRVFVAEELSLGRRVVLKVLTPELGHALSAARFEREMRLAARLQHPHIVPLLAAGQVGETLYYTMPFIEGESLRLRLTRSGELPIADAVRILRDVADALSYAHREHIVHRDIKPDNILISHRHAMVTDFGVARALAEAGASGTLTGTGIAVGTPAYMAPEQAVGEAQLDHRADIYALGVLAYELLSGTMPFQATTFQALVAAHVAQEPTPLATLRPSVPAELAQIVHRCLAKRAADRHQDAGEIVTALDALPLGSGSRPAPQAPSGITRRQALLGGAAAGLLGLTGGRATALAGAVDDASDLAIHRLTFRRGMIRGARFAPDFKTVLYGALWDGDECRVYSVRPESPESAPLNLPPAMPLAVSAAGEIALSLGAHRRGIMSYGTLAQVPLAGGVPRALQENVRFADWSPDSRDLAVVRRTDGGEHLEFPVGRTIATPRDPGGGFSFVRVSPRGDAVAAFELTQRLWLWGRVVIVGRDGTSRRSTERFYNVFGLAWRDDEVWFTAADALPLFRNTVYAMSPSGRTRIVARVPGNVSLYDIAPDGRVLLARTDDRSGISIRRPGESVERDLSWLDAAVLADFSADGSQILFSEEGVGGGPRRSAYLRGSDGSPALRLGDGVARALSPDARWAAVMSEDDNGALRLVPTGAGDSTTLTIPGLRLLDARWLSDGTRLVVRAIAADGKSRLYAVGRDGSAPTAITPAGLDVAAVGWAVAPNDRDVAVSTADGVRLFAVSGGDAGRPLPGTRSRWTVVGWITSGLLLAETPVDGGRIERIDPASGIATRWADIYPPDPAGVMNDDLTSLRVTPDGRSYGHSWHRALSDLYLIDGWR